MDDENEKLFSFPRGTFVATPMLGYGHNNGGNTMKKELLEGLTEEQIAKVNECGDVNDLLQMAEDEGVQLNEEQLAAVSGGGCGDSGKKDDDNKKDNNGHRKYES